jgi:hypothetical protein
MGILSKLGFWGVFFIGPTPPFLGIAVPLVVSVFDTSFPIVRYG